MKIICIKNTAKNLDLKKVWDISSNNYRYELTIGKEYLVMGIALYKKSNCLYYLIDHEGWPDWYPYMLFEFTNNALPTGWYIKIFNNTEFSDVCALWGFKELCNNDDFYDALMDRDEKAMRIYFDQKGEIENDSYSGHEQYNNYIKHISQKAK